MSDIIKEQKHGCCGLRKLILKTITDSQGPYQNLISMIRGGGFLRFVQVSCSCSEFRFQTAFF